MNLRNAQMGVGIIGVLLIVAVVIFAFSSERPRQDSHDDRQDVLSGGVGTRQIIAPVDEWATIPVASCISYIDWQGIDPTGNRFEVEYFDRDANQRLPYTGGRPRMSAVYFRSLTSEPEPVYFWLRGSC